MNERAKRLAEGSKQVILMNQHPSGGYVACPLFFHYAYGWLRDGTFTAYAMDTAGEHESAALFYRWVHEVVLRQKKNIESLIERSGNGETIPQNDFLNTRYHLNGAPDDAPWGHFQLDGYGTWLWGLAEHIRITGDSGPSETFKESIDATVAYIRQFWRLPNFDCWEEHGDKVHPASLACLFGGLRAIAGLRGRDGRELAETAEEIRQLVETAAIRNGRFVKSLVYGSEGMLQVGLGEVDASLMWLTEPFLMFSPDHPEMAETLQQIEADLTAGGAGVRRYPEDSYYGGGEWIILTAWLGLVRLRQGRRQEAEACLDWIVDKADVLGRLPEQVQDHLNAPEQFRDWQARLGHPAVPLLWSHAMYLILYGELQRNG